MNQKVKKRIEIRKECFTHIPARKFDRILLSGPAEISLDEIRVTGGLDYEVKIIISMPHTTEIVKLNSDYKLREPLLEKGKDSLD